MKSGSVYVCDTATDPLAPKLYKTISGDEIKKKTNIGNLHTSHCLGSGEIMVSAMGDAKGNGKGSFLILDENFNIKGKL